MNEVHRVTARHLEVEGLSTLRRIKRSRRRRLMVAIIGLAILILATAAVLALSWRGDLTWRPWFWGEESVNEAVPLTSLPKLPAPDLYRPLTAEEAQEKNAERPIEAGPGDPAAAFKLNGNDASKLRALECLTQAIYYEAASEGVDGGRAVAQVVLNRVRHPGYPASICGTVYQGSERITGCQFTFTCDGSLSRVPMAYLWARSRRIAQDALAGRIYAPVGLSTHYHADYVLPYWADSLDKAAVVGRHIFYRLKGLNGTRRAFSQPYSKLEPTPPLPSTPIELPEDLLSASDAPVAGIVLPETVSPKVEEDKIAPLAIPQVVKGSDNQPLAADLARGQLILGEPSEKRSRRDASQADQCAAAQNTKLKAMTADDLSATSSSQGC